MNAKLLKITSFYESISLLPNSASWHATHVQEATQAHPHPNALDSIFCLLAQRMKARPLVVLSPFVTRGTIKKEAKACLVVSK